MNLDDIRIFTKVIESGSFTKAASALAMPKSTVSRRVSELEDALSVRLIQRTTRKLHLTDAGQLYFNQTSRLLEELQHTEAVLSHMQAEPQGRLRLTTPGDLSGTLPELISQFQDRYPLVEIINFVTTRRVDLIAEGYDLALRAGRLTDSSLVFRTLYRSHLSLYASPLYLEKHPPISSPSDLASHRCIIFSEEHLETTWQLHGPSGTEDVQVKGRLASGDFYFIRGAVLAGQGVGFIPHFAGMTYETSGDLVRVLPDYKSDESSLFAVYPSARHLTPKVRAFIDFATEWMKSSTLVV